MSDVTIDRLPAEDQFRRLAWEINCPVCFRSSWDGKHDDEGSDRCWCCGQLPARESDA